MARLTIPDEDTSASFPVTTPTSVFPISFALFEKADLLVTVDDVEVSQADFTFSGTLLDGGGYQGGSVTLNTAVDDVTVLIRRVVNPLRPSNFGLVTSVPVRSVDMALNRLTATQQDLQREVGRIQFEGVTAGLDAPGARAALDSLKRDGSDADADILENLPYDAGGTGSVPYGLAGKVRQEMRSVLDYGADPSQSADSTAAFNNALVGGAAVYVPPGAYRVSGTINRPLGSTLFGDQKFRAGLYPQAGNYPLFRILGSFTDTSNLVVDSINKTGGPDVQLAIAGDVVETHFSNIITDRSFGWFQEDWTSGKHFRTYFSGIKNLRHRGPGYVFTKAFAFIYIDDKCVVDFPGSLSPNHAALSATGGTLGVAEGGFFCGLQVGGTFGTAGTTSAQKAFVFTDMGEVHMQGARADTCGEGMLFDGCTNLYLEGVAAKLNDSHQLVLRDCLYVVGSGIRLNGRNLSGLSGSAAKDGLRLEGATDVVQLVGVQSIENTGHGFQHIAGTEVSITGFQARTNVLRGVKTGTAGVVKFTGGGMNANVAGNYDLGGALHSITDAYNSAGAIVNQVGVGTG